MKLRNALAAGIFSLAFLVGTASAVPQVHGHQLSVDATDVDHYLSTGFPQTHSALGGLVSLIVSQPHLTLPAGERLDLSFDLALGSGGGSPSPLGRVALSSGLRYDNAHQGVFLDQPAIERFTPSHGNGELDTTSRELLNAWLRDYARKQPVYRLAPDISKQMGNVQVQSVAVQDGRLVVNFNQDIGALLPANALQLP